MDSLEDLLEMAKKHNKLHNIFRKRLIYRGIYSLTENGFRITWYKFLNRVNFGGNAKISNEQLFSDAELEEQRRHLFPQKILISIVVPLYNTPEAFLRDMIESVQAQTYAGWELCLPDGSDQAHAYVEKICREYAEKDSRIRYRKLKKNLGICGNSNAGLEMARGDYIGLLDHDDLLHPAALHEVMRAICEKGSDFIYTDEAVFQSPDINEIVATHFKPDYAIDNLRGNNYICHFSVFQRLLLEKTGGFRDEYEGSQDHDLFLRLTDVAKTITHIPMVLYYWRSHPDSTAYRVSRKKYAVAAGKKAVLDHLEQKGVHATIESSLPNQPIYRIKYELKEKPLVSILIPTKNRLKLLKECLNSIFKKTTYQNYEIILVDNGSDEEKVFSYYKLLERDHPEITITYLNIPFNFPALINDAAHHAKGDYYILLNNDVSVMTPEWIEEMLMYAQREDVGAVGCMLCYPNNKIQHAGFILGLGDRGIAGHAFMNMSRYNQGPVGRHCYAQNISAVSGACMMVKASQFHDVGGFDETLQVAFNDVDFCLKLRNEGYLNVWTPFAVMRHDKSESRGYEGTQEKRERFDRECTAFRERWKRQLDAGDPYYNPNFSMKRSDFHVDPGILSQHDFR